MKQSFKAFRLDKQGEDFSARVDELLLVDLPDSEVLIEVHYSSVNYKDGLASTPNSSIVKSYPFVPGIDLAGIVVESKDERFKRGDQVIATSYEIGVSHYGGYSEYAKIPANWIVPLPEGMSLKESMVYGTAGFTAALSIYRLEQVGLTPNKGKVLVTGASGGVGSMAVAMLAKSGYHVVASTGKESAHPFLYELGAKEVISREEVYEDKVRPLDKQLWAAAIDPVGGQTLASILSKINYGGAVAVSGLTGGTAIPTAVFPFILRGVSLIGIDSAYCPMEVRKQVWERMTGDLKPKSLEYLSTEITFKELPETLSNILNGKIQGRTIVRIH
ncbi:acryloyl-CoA reductase [Aquibacillus halophilus]|uniref:Acryloyl-CoA reductase n=1 Tax=Aquibacillus halophilus TaxID=930132 RepID=A0A6A8DEW7_9BACI|nr:acryloyl-CoA reductase [Aquibacillus halophilus]MRH44248.1 acryloyl-CoA reductase [Aquibacillus halophilus]